MEKDELFNIWSSGNQELFQGRTIGKDMIEKLIRKKTRRDLMPVSFNLAFFFFFQLVNVCIIPVNLAGYVINPLIFWILVGLMVFSVGVLIYGIHLFYRFREINIFSDSLNTLINKQLRFFKTSYEFWLFLIPVACLIMSFNLGLIVDYDNGQFRINHPGVFILTFLVVFIIVYGSQKIASLYFTKNLKANLNDLRKGILDETIKLEAQRKTYRWVWFVLFIILAAFLVAGLLKFKHFG